MLSRFKKELLHSDLDLKTSDVVEDGTVLLKVTARHGGPRILFGLFFGIPCLILLLNALFSRGIYSVASAVLFCPVLALLALLFGFAMVGKSFDRSRGIAQRSLRVFGYVTVEEERLPHEGVVEITHEMTGGGQNTPGGTMKYRVKVSPCEGFGFVVYKHFRPAGDFAERLARFLDYRLQNKVPPGLQLP